MGSGKKNDALSQTNDVLKQKFDEFAASHQNNSSQPPDLLLFQDDYLIRPWVIHLNKIINELNELISLVESTWQQSSTQEDKLHAVLQDALPKLSDLIEEKEGLRAAISKRKKLLLPSEITTNKASLSGTRNELREALISFLTIFSMIQFENTGDPTHLVLKNKLKEFLEGLFNELRAINPSANAHFVEFHGKLLRHLNLTVPLFSSKVPTELNQHAINAFVNNLFSTATTKPNMNMPFGENSPKILNGLWNNASSALGRLLDNPSDANVEAYGIKRQLIALRSLRFKLEDFPINGIKEYLFQTKKVKQRIAEINLTLQTLKRELKSKLDLFIEPYDDFDDVKEGHQLLAQLRAIEDEFEAALTQCNPQKSDITPPFALEHVEKLTLTQREIAMKLEHVYQELKGETGLYKKILVSSLNLDNQYQLTFVKLKFELRKVIQNAKTVFSAYLRLSKEIGDESAGKEAQKTLDLLENKCQEIRTKKAQENTPLATFRKENELTSQTFEQLGQVPREQLNPAYKKILDALIQRAQLPLPRLNETNSLASNLAAKREDAVNAIRCAAVSYGTFTTSNKQCASALLAFTNATNALNSYEKLKQEALIEDRKSSKIYLKSLEIVKVLQNEYFRILDKYIDTACANNPEDIAELVILKEKLWTRHTFLSSQKIFTPLLDKIDPRLCRLLSLQFSFERLNEKYLNGTFLQTNTESTKDKNPLSTGQMEALNRHEQRLYKDKLIHTIELTMHNENMEYISDGIRYDFVQWIRIHLLKPLQHLMECCFGSSLFFTPTWRACKTEEMLVEAGNQFYDEITGLGF
ncbi:hypothetical protein [Legionella micdadei]|uniref:hypothetical protein n=1 Tax=Legionella micdadei TaxID=451 RepID=UPI0009EF6FCC|nr:hypothetical protein [Legionella micdadei]ARH00826.1 hypothetical protein B6V88_10585 [Legionella micdadei]NSL18481.1 hypothetical protein [Legionella micdadei]